MASEALVARLTSALCGGGRASVLCRRWRKPREETLAPAEARGGTGG